MKRCLVVDDSSVVRKIARRILEGLEFEVIEAEDGSKALEICKRGLPDAVLLDWNMPVMDGFEFMGHMRRLPGGDQPKVVFCTTENNVAHIAQALSGGANEYIMKPFDKDIIADKFAEVGLIPSDKPTSECSQQACERLPVTPAEYEYLRKLLRDHSGLDLSADKQYLIESRLSPLARKAGLSGIGDLVQKLQGGSSALVTSVVEAMTTNETFFFRDKVPFDHFRETIMPDVLKARAGRRSVRIWCAAGSTGQEPYSLAMSLKEMGAALTGWRVEIVATDLSQEVLEKSKAGIYSQFEVQRGLPIQLLVKYFKQTGETWQINPELRAMIQHRQLNLLHDFSQLGTFDVIFCRNVLIYFDQETKINIFNRLARQIESDGFLVLGAAETVVGLTDAFRPIPERRGLYKPNDARAAGKPAMSGAAPRMTAIAGLSA
jgi:chemotaxis protein methyltransferase CheR